MPLLKYLQVCIFSKITLFNTLGNTLERNVDTYALAKLARFCSTNLKQQSKLQKGFIADPV